MAHPSAQLSGRHDCPWYPRARSLMAGFACVSLALLTLAFLRQVSPTVLTHEQPGVAMEEVRELAAHLTAEDWDVRQRAIARLAEIIKSGSPAKVRCAACNVFEEFQDGNGRRCAALASALRNPDLVAALVGALRDEDSDVNAAATMALSTVRTPPAEAVPALLRNLRRDGENVQESAAYGLRRMGQQAAEAIPVLAKNAEDSDANTRYFSILVLVPFIDTSEVARRVIMRAVSDPDHRIRSVAERALSKPRPEPQLGRARAYFG